MPIVAEKKKEGNREERSMPIVVEKREGREPRRELDAHGG